MIGEGPNLGGLLGGEGVGGVVEAAGLNRFHLDGYSPPSDGDDQVDFSASDPHISGDNRGPATGQELGSKSFAGIGELPYAQIRTPGSSSSMLTSRKVNTLTF